MYVFVRRPVSSSYAFGLSGTEGMYVASSRPEDTSLLLTLGLMFAYQQLQPAVGRQRSSQDFSVFWHSGGTYAWSPFKVGTLLGPRHDGPTSERPKSPLFTEGENTMHRESTPDNVDLFPEKPPRFELLWLCRPSKTCPKNICDGTRP